MSSGPEKVATDGGASPLPENRLMSNTQKGQTRPEEEKVPPKEEEAEQRQEDSTSQGGRNAEGSEIEEGEEEEEEEEEEGEEKEEKKDTNPPLPNEDLPPPLPSEAPPGEDDGWEPVWDANASAYYFYNRFTRQSQWENPRVPDTSAANQDTAEGGAGGEEDEDRDDNQADDDAAMPVAGGYNPAIHGDYDPTAPYAQVYERQPEEAAGVPGMNPGAAGYEAVGSFNRFTGKWQAGAQNPEYHNDENKSKRQMHAFFDVDAAANSHDGRSLRAERSAKKLSKKELKMFKEKRREKKEEKRRAWLRD